MHQSYNTDSEQAAQCANEEQIEEMSYENVIEGQADEGESRVKSALAAGVEAGTILHEALLAAKSPRPARVGRPAGSRSEKGFGGL